MSIDRYFTLGPDAPYEAHDVFTDREEELAWFVDRIHDHAAVPWPASRQQDFQRPADNLVAFVGEGGIGKSTLVRRLADTAMTHESTDLPRRRATATVDFADAVNREFESVLLRTRAALGSLTRSWPAFDIALSVYWGRKHPGESVVSFLKRSSVLGGGSLSTQLADQVAATLDQLLGGLGVLGAGYRIAHSIGEKLSRSRAVHHLQEEFPAFGMILEERDPERMIGFMPSLLAYDLEQKIGRAHV